MCLYRDCFDGGACWVRGTNEVDLSGLVDGVYLVRIRDKEGRIFLEKVMVR